jgi:hypothetical protein
MRKALREPRALPYFNVWVWCQFTDDFSTANMLKVVRSMVENLRELLRLLDPFIWLILSSLTICQYHQICYDLLPWYVLSLFELGGKARPRTSSYKSTDNRRAPMIFNLLETGTLSFYAKTTAV